MAGLVELLRVATMSLRASLTLAGSAAVGFLGHACAGLLCARALPVLTTGRDPVDVVVWANIVLLALAAGALFVAGMVARSAVPWPLVAFAVPCLGGLGPWVGVWPARVAAYAQIAGLAPGPVVVAALHLPILALAVLSGVSFEGRRARRSAGGGSRVPRVLR